MYSSTIIWLLAKFFEGREVVSTELVPGDVYEVSDPSLSQFPCDSLLLAGDCIVNESMLTGEYHAHENLKDPAD